MNGSRSDGLRQIISIEELNNFLHGGPKSAEAQTAAFPQLGELIEELSEILYLWQVKGSESRESPPPEMETVVETHHVSDIRNMFITQAHKWMMNLYNLTNRDARHNRYYLMLIQGFIGHLLDCFKRESTLYPPGSLDKFFETLEIIQQISGNYILNIEERLQSERFP